MGDGLFVGATLGDRGEIAAPFHLAAEELRTHGVVVGMTGSGKTGLSLVLLEELARAGVPVLAIDPKGDLGNLALLFPRLAADEFAPWVEDGDPAEVAGRWRVGLERWGLGADQVRALAEQVELTVYTPGSHAGVGVDILGAFRRPADADDPDARRALVAGTVSGLLGLVGRSADPVRDPGHIVLSRILDDAWAANEDPDLETLILRLVDPPFTKVGVFPLDRFFPADDRMALAMALNAVVASPSFEVWTSGAALDPAHLLATPAEAGGRTRVSVFSLAHLPDGQRQFFLALLLGRLMAWSRGLPGTSGLRAVLFFDEVAGFLPPHPYDPPTKAPLLTMMKQARAVGLGVVLATQNPVDVDYKALSNAGLWCIGRLQTKQDRDRLLKGLGRPDLDARVEGLGKRQFLVHQAGRDEPAVVASRHALCYLRGPLTAAEIERLGQAAPRERAAGPPPAATAAPAPVDDGLLPAPPPVPGSQWFLDPRVVFSARLDGVFEAAAQPPRPDGKLAWLPALHADLELRFDEDSRGWVRDERHRRVWFPLGQALPAEARQVALEDADLLAAPEGQGRFAPLPSWMDEARELAALQKQVVEDLYRREERGMWVNARLGLYGRSDESRADFDQRCREAVEERVAQEVGKLRDRFAREGDRLDDRIRRQEAKIAELQGAARTRQAEELVNIGETVWSLFSGRKKSLTTAMSKRRQVAASQDRLGAAEQELADLTQKAYELENQLEAEIRGIREAEERLLDATEEKAVRLEKNDIRVVAFGVLWVPVSRRI